MSNKIEITIESNPGSGKSSVANAIKHMLESYGIKCSVTGCEDEIQGEIERTWHHRLNTIASRGASVNIVTKQTCCVS